MTDLESLKSHPGVFNLYRERLKLERAGTGEYKAKCPFHNERKGAAFLLNNKENGRWLWRCTGACAITGSIIDFIARLESISDKQAIERVKALLDVSWEESKEQVEKTFQPVAPDEPKQYKTYTMLQFAKQELALADSHEAQQWLLRERGITYETARRLHLGFRPSLGEFAGPKCSDIDGKGWISFPCIENGVVTSIKYRSIARKAFSRQPGMATALWNTETVDPLEPIFVVEGELDAATMEQAGFKAVSIPSASFKFTPAMKDLLVVADGVVLAGESDEAGESAAANLMTGLNDKALRLIWPPGIKDANEAFLKHCGRDIEKFQALVNDLVLEARSRPMPGIYSLAESMATSKGTNLAEAPDRLRFPWPTADKMVILRPGSVLYFSATGTKMGKTSAIMNVTIDDARKHGEVVLNYQCELSTDEFSNITASHLLQKNRTGLTREDYQTASKLLNGAQYYVGHDPTLTTVTPVLDLIERAVVRFDASIVVLDHIHFVCRNEANEIQAQANAMQRIKLMAKKHKLKFIVVGQPRKAQQANRGQVVHITDAAKGSEALTSDADAILIMHRKWLKAAVDPNNPPNDDYDPETNFHLLGARSRGNGPTFAQVHFFGSLATFREIDNKSEPPA